MGGIERRLRALEAIAPKAKREIYIPRSLERFWHEQDSARRVQNGLPPLEPLEYTKEDYQDDLITLREHIPAMKSDPGWQTEEGQAFLSEWEDAVKERLERKQA